MWEIGQQSDRKMINEFWKRTVNSKAMIELYMYGCLHCTFLKMFPFMALYQSKLNVKFCDDWSDVP